MMNFVFYNLVRFEEDAATMESQLDATHHEQFLLAAEAYCGEKFDSIEDFFDWNQEEIGEPPSCELWQIKTDEEPAQAIYEMWVINVDSGSVFKANTAEKTGIQMVQFGFEFYPESSEVISDSEYEQTQQLADRLQAAFHRDSRLTSEQ